MSAPEIGWRASEGHCGFEVGPKELLHSERLYNDRCLSVGLMRTMKAKVEAPAHPEPP